MAGATQSGIRPDRVDGFNLEGAEFAPGGSDTLYIGFRSPVYPRTVDGDALIVPLTNLAQITSSKNQAAAHAQFGEPILLDLGGMDIRELRKNANDQYVILAGSNEGVTPFQEALFSWSGKPADQPVKLSTTLVPSAEAFTDGIGSWEGIGALPDTLTAGEPVKLVMDQGYDELYTTAENKGQSDQRLRKSRVDTVTLSARAGAPLTVAPPTFPDQAAGTIGPVRSVTVTNDSGLTIRLSHVAVRADEESLGDFIVADQSCDGVTLDSGESCRVVLRYAPSRESATSTANLVITADVDGGQVLVPLTADSTVPTGGPAGPAGPEGPSGPTGDDGAQGPEGPTGPTGPGGAQGPEGPAGPSGPTGSDGPAGPAGTDGTDGARGGDGAPGHDGASGARGDDGAAGATGGNGRDGATGAQGPAGPAGSRGAKGDRGPKGDPAKVSCTVKSVRGVSATISCKLSGGAGRARAGKAKARLVRAGRTYAVGTLGALRVTRSLKAGRYALVVGTGKAASRTAVTVRRTMTVR